MFKHVLIPTDGSELSDSAIERGVELAKALSARITFLVVVEPFRVFDFSADQLEETRASYEAHAQAHADATLKQAEKIAETAKVACDSVKLTGDQPYEAIIETSANQGCDLIAMASHGRRGLAAVMLGSQTMKVLVSSKIPVLVFR